MRARGWGMGRGWSKGGGGGVRGRCKVRVSMVRSATPGSTVLLLLFRSQLVAT